MWRIFLLIGFSLSIALNIYLFLQLNIHVIETTFQQDVNNHSLQRLASMKKNKGNVKNSAKITSNESSKNWPQTVNNIKNAINVKDYSNANFLIHTFTSEQQTELSEIRLYWLQTTQALIQQRLFTHAEDSINAYLAFQSDDIDFMYQQVDLYWQQQLPLLAIKHAYEVQYHLFNRAEVHERHLILMLVLFSFYI